MTRNRLALPVVAAAAFTVVSSTVAMPVANARQEIPLDNGLLAIVLDPQPDGQIRARTLGRPLVRTDLVTQLINVQRTGIEQKEFPIDEANSLSDTFAVEPGQTVKVQACRSRGAITTYSFCTDWSTFFVEPPAAPAAAEPPPVAAPPPPEVKPPVVCPAGSPVTEVPAGQTCPPPKKVAPTNAVTMSIERGLQVKVTVANTSDLAAQCTYNAEEVNGLGVPVNRDFALGPKDDTTLTFPAPLPGQAYRVEVACTADFEGNNVEIGRVADTV